MIAPLALAAVAVFLIVRARSGAALPSGFSGDAATSRVVTASSQREYIVLSWPPRKSDGATYQFAALRLAPETHFIGYLQFPQATGSGLPARREMFRIKAPTAAEKIALLSDFGMPTTSIKL
jgi:hypothetical protein